MVSRNINYNRGIPTQRNIPRKQPGQVDFLRETCRQCRTIGDCGAFPFCTTSKSTCEWKETWDGKWVQQCKSY